MNQRGGPDLCWSGPPPVVGGKERALLDTNVGPGMIYAAVVL
ncbi:MAG TPA: hypothetical protein VK276_08070 [Rubrobacteraceae bacterium]|nr:hypothetical protein [Rubrobacteraceae bacterium]